MAFRYVHAIAEAGNENIRNVAVGERIGNGPDKRARDIDVENRGVDRFGQQAQRIGHARRRADNPISRVDEHILGIERDQRLVLDHQNALRVCAHAILPARFGNVPPDQASIGFEPISMIAIKVTALARLSQEKWPVNVNARTHCRIEAGSIRETKADSDRDRRRG